MAPSDPDPSPLQPRPEPAPPTFAARIFLGPYGLRAGWRVVFFYLALFVFTGIALAATALLRLIKLGPDATRLLDDFATVAGVFAASFVMVHFDRKAEPAVTFARAGLPSAAAFRNAATGLVCGFLAVCVLMGALTAGGLYTIQSPQWTLPALGWALYWAVQFVCTGFFEEMTMRGYSLSALTQGIGFWPAALILSIFFGAGHLGNGGEQWLGIANAILVGIVLAWSVRFTGSLWWAIGAHASWDWGETYFWGVSDSGFVSSHHLFAGLPKGLPFLSGGSVGPEGSLLCIAAIGLLFLMARFTGFRATAPPWTRTAPPELAPAAPVENLSIIGDGSRGEFPKNGQ